VPRVTTANQNIITRIFKRMPLKQCNSGSSCVSAGYPNHDAGKAFSPSSSGASLCSQYMAVFFYAMRSFMVGVGIAAGHGLDDGGVGVRVPVGSRIFSSPRRPERLWAPTQPPIKWVPGVNRSGREADVIMLARAKLELHANNYKLSLVVV
jgi:hypothetical protein